MSSPTLTTAVISSGGRTCTRPVRKRAAPTPPAMTVITAGTLPAGRVSPRRRPSRVARACSIASVAFDHGLAESVDVEADGPERLGRDPVGHRHGEEQVLAAEVVVAEGERLAGREVEDPAGLRRERDAAPVAAVGAAPASPATTAGPGRRFCLGREQATVTSSRSCFEVTPAASITAMPTLPGHVEDAEQEVLGADEGVVGRRGPRRWRP